MKTQSSLYTPWLAAFVLAVASLTGCGGGGSDDDNNIVTLSRVEVTPTSPSIAKGTTQQFAATAVFSDSTTQDVTSTATWASSNTMVATVNSAGLASGNNTGSSNITATLNGVSGSSTLTVTPAILTQVQVTPTNPSNAKGTTRQFTATGIFSDGTNQNVTSLATWSSSSAGMASVSDAAGTKGLATANNVGSATISAMLSGLTGSTTMTVTPAVVTAVQVTPTNPSIAKGTTQQFTATAVFSDATTQNVTADAGTVWASSNTGVATISNAVGTKGLATGLTEGSTTISASFMGMSGNTTLTITPAVISRVDVTPVNPSVPKGSTQQFTATAVFTDSTTQPVTDSATWSSSNDAIATVSNAAGSKGLAAANAEGSATISALFDGVTGSTTMTVTPASITAISVTPTNPSLPDGFNLQFTATGTLSDGTTRNVTTEVTWLTTNSAVATVSNALGSQGLATAVDPGFTTVVAQSGAVQGSTGLTVTDATLSSIGVTPNPVSVAKGLARQFAATGTFSDMSTMDITNQVTWTSSDTGVATVSNATGSEGLAQTVDTGSTTITATRGVTSGDAALTVTDAEVVSIEISPNPATVAKGLQTNLSATGTFTDGTTMDITEQATWDSSDNAIAVVSNVAGTKGTVTGLDEGTVTISAELGGVTGNGSLTVTAALLQSIDVTPDAPSVPLGLEQQFTAMGTYSDGSMLDITDSVTWDSSDTGVATVSNAAGSEGLATTLSEGSTDISATLDSISGQETLTVTPVALIDIDITPANATLPKGTLQQYTATGNFSDGTTQDLTTQATWVSGNTAVFDISNAAGSEGLGVAIDIGSTTVSATFSSVTGMTNVTVGAAALQSIAVTPANSTLPNGFSRQYTATGNFSDGSTQDLTTQVTWSTLNAGVASVSNAAGSKGVVTGTGAGSTNVVATKDGLTGQTLITVTSDTLTSIAVTPANATIGPGQSIQYTAIGTFSDASTLNITTQVTWASSNTNVATISNTAGSQGRATAGSLPGNTTISATRNGVTGSTTLTRGVI